MTDLTTALQHESAAVRWRAIEKFSQQHRTADAATLTVLSKALADSHPFVRWQAGRFLAGQAGGRQKLIETLQDSSQSEQSRAAAVDALGQTNGPELAELLIEALRTGGSQLRQSAAEALAQQKNSEAIPQLIIALQDVCPLVRRAAAYALGHMGDTSLVPSLLACLQDESIIVQRSAIYALGALRAEAAMPHLKAALHDTDPLIRRNAAWSLGRLGHKDALPELTRLLDDPALDGTIAAVTQQAITEITQPGWLRWARLKL